MRVPRESIPEDCFLLYSEAMECLPDRGRGRFAPGNMASRKPLTSSDDSRHRAGYDEPLTGESHSSDVATLITRRFADQDLRGLDAQMRAQTLASRRGTIKQAIVAFVALRPGIEYVWAAVDGQEPQKAAEGRGGHGAGCS